MVDPLGALMSLPGVADSAAAARAALDGVLWDRRFRPRAADLVAESRLRGGWASAALDGADVRPEMLRAGGALDSSPIGMALAASLDLQGRVPRLVAVFERAPMQAWAQLHAVAAHDFSPRGALGRPRSDEVADDPLHLGQIPVAAQAVRRVEALGSLLVGATEVPAVVLAAIAHGELLATRPFAWGSGLVARATVRLVLASRGVDPDGMTVPETGMLSLGRPSYATAARDYISGTPEGVARWLTWSCEAFIEGARETERAFETLAPSR